MVNQTIGRSRFILMLKRIVGNNYFPYYRQPLLPVPYISKAYWDAYSWNPPSGYSYTDPDPRYTFPKPTWEEVVALENEQFFTEKRPELLTGGYNQVGIYAHCRKLICALYEGKDLHDEIYNRRTVRDAASPELLLAGKLQDDAKRAYLIRYHQIKNYINNTTDRTAMEAFNPTDDAHWDLTADWVRPDGEPTALDADDITGLAFTTDDVRKEERFRIDQIVDPGQLSRIQNDMISTILTEGIDQTQWTQAATDRWVRLQGFTGRIHTIQERCADIMDMDAIPTDFKEDHWWGDTRYVPPADDNTPPSS